MRKRTKDEWDKIYVQNVKDEKRLRERILEYQADEEYLELEFINMEEEGARIDKVLEDYEKAKAEFRKIPKVNDFIADKGFNSKNYPELEIVV